ncbi:MAG TPA: TolC family protein [Acidobacteriaceae bacterium]|nr:TolC family protein [Acidobacteriaceae bacterium]
MAGKDTGVVKPAGSGIKFVAPSTMAGPGGFAVERPVDGPLPLSLDDAISLGLARNVRLKFEHANQRAVRGYQGQIDNAILPNLQFRAASSAQELNLAALGFNPTKVGPLLAAFGINPSSLQTIVKVNTTTAQISLDQQLFNMPDFELYRAIKPEFKAVDLNVADSDEQLVQAVTTAYLKVLADQANLNNAIAQEVAAKALLDQATARDQAGVGIRLDVLRAQVDYQQRQQAHVSADNQLDKDGIQLNRIMGLPAGQQLDLTDEAPFAELGDVDLEQARATAMARRSDLLALQQSIIVASHEVKAVRYQRLPTLAVNGFYGVLGETTGLYHGVFTAEGSLKVPVFREAGQRGEQDTVEAQLQQLRDQEENLRGTIEAQIRTSLLDVETASQLVQVARSNVDLSQQELTDAEERFKAGVTDNLEVVDAEAAVTGSQAQLVSALYQFNVAKVSLARSTGVLQSRYRAFLGM